MFAVNIDWDTDGDTETRKQLPTVVKIPDSLHYDVGAIADYLSDEYGFCVFDFDLAI